MATDNKDFLKQQTDSSRVKATIISEYFPSYRKIIGRHHVPKKFGYYDMFAGPGMYEDGGLSTPLLVAGKCANDSYLRERVWMVFNDMMYGDTLINNIMWISKRNLAGLFYENDFWTDGPKAYEVSCNIV